MAQLDFASRFNGNFHIESTDGSSSLSHKHVDSEPVDDITYTKLAQFSLNNVHKRGLKHHHFI